jgi:hypothetical protein
MFSVQYHKLFSDGSYLVRLARKLVPQTPYRTKTTMVRKILRSICGIKGIPDFVQMSVFRSANLDRATPRNPQLPLPAIEFKGSAILRLVIPTEAQRSGGICGFLDPLRALAQWRFSTEAYPDFLPRTVGHGRVCGFPLGKAA